ncbi:hypothetical protein ABCS02_10045 [Microbacterium sp. X-17]|uniref:hypothetical protein n=1 Tax=Microbacterium sp. X-17 TaxID=3144404 RepID=UPI0031F56363
MTARPHLTRALLAVTLAAAIGALAVPPASAADGDVTWGIQPSTPAGPDGRTQFTYQVAPGTTITDWVGVVNDSTVPATFRVYAADATTDYDTAAFTLIGSDQGSRDLGGWTTIDTGSAACADTNDAAEAACAAGLGVSVTLNPGTTKNIPFTIAVPQDATPGDHAAGIVASYATDGGSGGATVRQENRVGTRIYLRVDGPLTPALGVSGAVAGYQGTVNPVGAGSGFAGFDLRNTGNTRLSAQPVLHFAGPFGIDLGTLALPPVKNIVPGGTAHVTGLLPGVAPLLLLFADMTVTPLPGDGLAASDPLPAGATASAATWAVPWMLLGILVVVVGGIALIVFLRRRSRDRLAEDLAAYADQIREEARSEKEQVR